MIISVLLVILRNRASTSRNAIRGDNTSVGLLEVQVLRLSCVLILAHVRVIRVCYWIQENDALL